MRVFGLIGVIAALASLLAVIGSAGSAVAQADGVDYDTDDDNLIEITYLEQLDAVRWGWGKCVNEYDDEEDCETLSYEEHREETAGNNQIVQVTIIYEVAWREAYIAAFPDPMMRMGCPDECIGYELTRSLDFKNAGSYASDSVNRDWTSGNGWLPIDWSQGILEGNGHTIANLFIRRGGRISPQGVGLFVFIDGEADIRRIGLVGVDIRADTEVGGLAGRNYGPISDSYVTGDIIGYKQAGGLTGTNYGQIVRSHANARASGKGTIGGLVGENLNLITESYSRGRIEGGEAIGGLVGSNQGTIMVTYSTANVSGEHLTGGLVGSNFGSVSAS